MSNSSDRFVLEIEAKILPLAQKLGTRNGFIEYWFKVMPRCGGHKKAFDIVNDLHVKIFNEEKYTSYDSFRKQKERYLKSLRNE